MGWLMRVVLVAALLAGGIGATLFGARLDRPRIDPTFRWSHVLRNAGAPSCSYGDGSG